MAIVKFDPFRGFEGLSRRMNRLVSDFDRNVHVETGNFVPRVDITENNENIFIHAELPGLTKKDISVSVSEDNIITIKGEKKHEHTEKKKSYIRTERSYGSFERSFMLPENVNLDKIDARFESGVLEVRLTKKEPAKPKEISVNIQ